MLYTVNMALTGQLEALQPDSEWMSSYLEQVQLFVWLETRTAKASSRAAVTDGRECLRSPQQLLFSRESRGTCAEALC